MRRWIGLLGLACWLGGWAQPGGVYSSIAYDAAHDAYYVANEWIVSFAPHPFRGFAHLLLQQLGRVRLVASSLDTVVLQFDSRFHPDDIREILHALPGVRYVERNYLVFACNNPAPNDPLWVQQWNLPKIGALQAWGIWQPRRVVYIAIIDTGVDSNHPDLAHKMRRHQNGAVYGYNAINNTPNTHDGHGHGTHCAGIAAAHIGNGIGIAGVAGWNPTLANAHQYVQIMPVKVLHDNGAGTSADVARGIVWAADNGAHVLNLSLGASVGAQVLADAVNYAWNRGCLVVAAAGNEGSSAPFYPAFYERAIAVAATDSSDCLTPFSQYGAWVDIAAPGSSILSTVPSGYQLASGTSMAAPHVAGAAALIWAHAPSLTNQQLRTVLENHADPYQPYWFEGIGEGKGRLNVYRALQAAIALESTPQLSELDLSASTVQAGGSVQGTVVLSRPAGADGVVVQLQSDNPQIATCPSSVVVPPGQTSAVFTVHTAPDGHGTAQIVARLGEVVRTAALQVVSPYRVQELSATPSRVLGGQSLTLSLQLNLPAPQGGLRVRLSSSRPSVVPVPPVVVVPTGQNRYTFTIRTSSVAALTQVVVRASYADSQRSVAIQVNPPAPVALSISPSSVRGGRSATATVTLNANAPAEGLWVHVSHDQPQRVVAPDRVYVRPGMRVAQFVIDTHPGRGVATATITVSTAGGSRSATLTIVR
ncbi:MAG: S8 family peptidase [Armatimonadota bacterium]|nr:S8 family peptidase [Armatimonadota bacterium]